MAVAMPAGHDRDMNENATYEPSDTPQPHRLTRTRSGRMITGVCSGAAAYFNVDPTIVRVVVAVLTVLTSGAGILLYAAATLIIPEEGKAVSIAQELIDKQTRRNDS
jgi:phage shock protein PspC (stress-responsive transcriptional regulator)